MMLDAKTVSQLNEAQVYEVHLLEKSHVRSVEMGDKSHHLRSSTFEKVIPPEQFYIAL